MQCPFAGGGGLIRFSGGWAGIEAPRCAAGPWPDSYPQGYECTIFENLFNCAFFGWLLITKLLIHSSTCRHLPHPTSSAAESKPPKSFSRLISETMEALDLIGGFSLHALQRMAGT